MRRVVFALGVVAIGAAVLLPGAMGRSAVPGVTPKIVSIGGTFPFSGPASSYAPIPVGMQAYFSYANAKKTNGKRGVFGRQIKFNAVDDGYNPALTVQKTKQLVEQDKVFALVGGLGTEPQEAVTAYANQQKVPQIYVSTGATEWGARDKHAGHPWTIGWQPDYQAGGGDLRPLHRQEPAEREDRDHLPERQLRPGLHQRPPGRTRLAQEPDRQPAGLRGHRHLGDEPGDRPAARAASTR